MANTTFYNRGDAYHDSSGNPAIIKRGNELIFTEHFNAGGGGTLEPATANTLGGVKVGNGLNVANDGTLSVEGVDYSTNEHLIGRKWIDGKDIYQQILTLNVTTLSNNTTVTVLNDVTDMSMIINAGLVVKASAEIGFDHALCYINIVDNKLYMKSSSTWNNITEANLIIEYTKPTLVEPTNTRTVKKTVKKRII